VGRMSKRFPGAPPRAAAIFSRHKAGMATETIPSRDDSLRNHAKVFLRKRTPRACSFAFARGDGSGDRFW